MLLLLLLLLVLLFLFLSVVISILLYRTTFACSVECHHNNFHLTFCRKLHPCFQSFAFNTANKYILLIYFFSAVCASVSFFFVRSFVCRYRHHHSSTMVSRLVSFRVRFFFYSHLTFFLSADPFLVVQQFYSEFHRNMALHIAYFTALASAV